MPFGAPQSSFAGTELSFAVARPSLAPDAPGETLNTSALAARRARDRGTPRFADTNGAGHESRTRDESTHETLKKKPDETSRARDESNQKSDVRDRSEPSETAPSPVSDADIERAIVGAVTAGSFDVAKVLATQLEDRRRAKLPHNVIAIGRPKK